METFHLLKQRGRRTPWGGATVHGPGSCAPVAHVSPCAAEGSLCKPSYVLLKLALPVGRLVFMDDPFGGEPIEVALHIV